jgi:hypothetical protein
MVVHVDNEKVAGSIESNLMGQVETSESGWSSISAVACRTVASDSADDSVLCNASNALPGIFAKPYGSVGTADNTERIIELGFRRFAPIAAMSFLAISCKGFDNPFVCSNGTSDKQGQRETKENKSNHGRSFNMEGKVD